MDILKHQLQFGDCYECLKDVSIFPEYPELKAPSQLMIVCIECGNKRCPKATDHNLKCTDSNATCQVGSRWHPNWVENKMNKSKTENEILTECHTEASEKFKLGGEDLTPVIQASRFGCAKGIAFKREQVILQLELILRQTTGLNRVSNLGKALSEYIKELKKEN